MAKTAANWGLLARYESPAEIFHACEKVRDAGYSKWDACTPFPVHGLENAMGLKASILPFFVLLAGITGGVSAMGFMLWTSAVDYPLNIGGKPTWSVPAFIPITFEFTVLLSCLTCFFALWFLCRLPQLFHPAFKSKAFDKVTDDKFFIMIESQDPRFDLVKTRQLLEDAGASLIEELED
jgi:hypothetical protein